MAKGKIVLTGKLKYKKEPKKFDLKTATPKQVKTYQEKKKEVDQYNAAVDRELSARKKILGK